MMGRDSWCVGMDKNYKGLKEKAYLVLGSTSVYPNICQTLLINLSASER